MESGKITNTEFFTEVEKNSQKEESKFKNRREKMPHLGSGETQTISKEMAKKKMKIIE